MSDTNSKDRKTKIGYTLLRGNERTAEIENARGRDIDNVVPPMLDIKYEAATMTNETPDGRTEVRDNATGKVIGVLNSNSRIYRKLAEIDEKNGREERE